MLNDSADGKPFRTMYLGQPVDVWLDNVTDRKVLLSSKVYDAEEIAFLEQYLPTDGLLVDIGANSGLISVGVLADRLDANLLAIEPNPKMAARARRNLIDLAPRLTGRRVIVEAAVSNVGGHAYLDLSEGLGKASVGGTDGQSSIRVACMPFSKILADAGFGKIDVMKIDIEGFEEVVVPDILASLSPDQLPRAIVMEKQASGAMKALTALRKANYIPAGETRANLFFVAL